LTLPASRDGRDQRIANTEGCELLVQAVMRIKK
jgi:hypothetical protein